jgi:GTPase
VQRRDAPTPPPSSAAARSPSSATSSRRARRRRGRVRRRPRAGAAAQPGGGHPPEGARPHHRDPRHLRPARHQPEGKAQVELAQLTYLLPRLRGWGTALSRQAGGRVAGGGGIGGRGPGETQLEVDRRRIMRRMTKLRATSRTSPRSARPSRGARPQPGPGRRAGRLHQRRQVVAAQPLTGAEVLVEDKLFATLDPTVRRLDRSTTVGRRADRHRRLRPQAAARARRGVQVDPRGVAKRRPAAARRRRVPPGGRGAHRRGPRGARGDRRRPGPRAARAQQDRPGRPATVDALARRVQVELGADPVLVSAWTGEGIDDLVERIQRGCRVGGCG